ncbi:protein PHLOEM PROTEIN 2-LIKE A9-like [Solanum dulcamara]|uniref:protein PHLOEM PROTEIN 2-LIKE A9-like n=1 Tax=Solanum dulcamara TaxID=45834 RepID=UPI0024858CB1|nr:protein PHLOEM PROTEIN 2-LIKE A9-like [Solanum dulcamara]
MASKSLHYQGNHTFSKTEKKDDAELIQVNWLEVTGCIDNVNIEKKTSYDIEFTMSLMTDAFGWSNSPVYLMAKWGDNTQWRKVNLTSDQINVTKMISKNITIAKGKGNNVDKIYFGLYEVWNKKWKGGLKIHYVNLIEI